MTLEKKIYFVGFAILKEAIFVRIFQLDFDLTFADILKMGVEFLLKKPIFSMYFFPSADLSIFRISNSVFSIDLRVPTVGASSQSLLFGQKFIVRIIRCPWFYV
jgi:hypothetical protein